MMTPASETQLFPLCEGLSGAESIGHPIASIVSDYMSERAARHLPRTCRRRSREAGAWLGNRTAPNSGDIDIDAVVARRAAALG